ncbi:hypothetical protein N7509_008994 [Penicillium cosmopolitanum]|uniref:Uncharacterized protein n=1 Tax=Penicillium cosmopolitanum TaxID=1131564 RepID=A0A9W9VNL2_9EURO|nr:uncharacterized protein N7509_008994 [Penicillium cosmopolitanum]KAJ5386453.1 hypothetical protein N7509_008994 [Penicillium cosmopolitanum]
MDIKANSSIQNSLNQLVIHYGQCPSRAGAPKGISRPELALASEITRLHPTSSACFPRVPLPDPHSSCALTGGCYCGSWPAGMACLCRFQRPS